MNKTTISTEPISVETIMTKIKYKEILFSKTTLLEREVDFFKRCFKNDLPIPIEPIIAIHHYTDANETADIVISGQKIMSFIVKYHQEIKHSKTRIPYTLIYQSTRQSDTEHLLWLKDIVAVYDVKLNFPTSAEVLPKLYSEMHLTGGIQ